MINDIIADAEQRMDKTTESLRSHLATIRTGRASPALLDRIHVEYYGTTLPINQLANISVPEPRLLVIQPWDKGAMAPIEKAIRKSDLGINPTNDGQVIRLAMPPLTEERRKQLVKQVHAIVEEGKVAVRNIRRDALAHIRELTDKGEVSENDERRANQKIEDLAKRHVEEADKIGKLKEHEVLEV